MATTTEIFERYATPDELRAALGRTESRTSLLKLEMSARAVDLMRVESDIVEACAASDLPFAFTLRARRAALASDVEAARGKVSRFEEALASAATKLEDARTVRDGEVEAIRQRHASDPGRDASIRYLDGVKTSLPAAKAQAKAALEILEAKRYSTFRNPLVALAAKLGRDDGAPGHFLAIPVRAAARALARRPGIRAELDELRSLERAQRRASDEVSGIVSRRDAERTKLDTLGAAKKAAVAVVTERFAVFEAASAEAERHLGHARSELVRAMARQREDGTLGDDAGFAARSAVRKSMSSGESEGIDRALREAGRGDLTAEWHLASRASVAAGNAHVASASETRDLASAVSEMDRRLRQASSRRGSRRSRSYRSNDPFGAGQGSETLTLAAVLAATEGPASASDCAPSGGYSADTATSSSCDMSSI